MPNVTKIAAIRALKGDEAAATEIIREVVKAKGSKEKAAKKLGVGSSTLYRMISELGIWEKIDEICKEKGFRSRAGRARGPVEPGTKRKIARARRSRKGA